MARDQPISVKDAIYKLQLSLLEGIQDENQLFAAGSLMSRSDYEDVVTERSIANICGYPLCRNSLLSDRTRKGRYHISVKEHKVYDLQETNMYCSSSCVVNSQAFAKSLQDERCLVLNSDKLNEVLRLFGNLSLDCGDDLGKNGDLGLSGLKIQEKTETKDGEVSLEQWIGPSNAIEGYVPQRDRSSKPSPSKNIKEGSKAKHTKSSSEKGLLINEIDFIITKDEYSVSKVPPGSTKTTSYTKSKEPKGKVSYEDSEDQVTIFEKPSVPTKNDSERKSRGSRGEKNKIVSKDNHSILEVPSASNPCAIGPNVSTAEAEEEAHVEKLAKSNGTILKSCLKPSGRMKRSCSVTWADEKVNGTGSGNLCDIRDVENKIAPKKLGGTDLGDDEMLWFVSAEACAKALSQAAEAVASEESDATDAVYEAGIIILPHQSDADEEELEEDVDMLEPESAPLKWPGKPGIPHPDLFDPEDSWYDAPPEGFSLALSPFATMWMALFEWTTSSSLAYIYGRDESFHEDYLSVNGKVYPCKIVLADGRSSEIKQTLAGCLARALPGLVADLRLPTPISILEQGMFLCRGACWIQ
ncbi:putative RNA polymerase II subunit B1 CTD phosphatase RPAP2 homolog isoform X2 [Alnus glutinosa]|uniref:putative RNA polymerase II subunit B1 CTD phosphatase RPAP2 homolog isoform X2 n=1 Tax=Alnus glutinosa TaxID=3517 RepID=UPI002D79418C|nr:putative RNA polymerase II subunit B1 CTD phosphatase RPAP2 homolog isoform X2 [Alnus glutinosa]